MVFQQHITLNTKGRDIKDITALLQECIQDSNIQTGICQIFCLHTSASLIICENADPSVQGDLERFITKLVPDGHPDYQHTAEGIDDMPAHIRSILTHTSLSCPVQNGQVVLGTWQGVYFWEHRTAPHTRKLLVTVYGE